VRIGDAWRATCANGEVHEAPILVNAAGAWADGIARMAGVAPIGVVPKKRTIIAIDPPPRADIARWPFVHALAGDFYMLPEAGRLLASPVDEEATLPCDAQPDELGVALAVDRLQCYTRIEVTRIAHRWAGLRSFVADRVPTAGFDADAPGFFWLAGQGGYGFQTAPAMAAITASLILDRTWPAGLETLRVTRSDVDPVRLRNGR